MRISCDDMYPFRNVSILSVERPSKESQNIQSFYKKTLILKLKVTKTLYRGKPELDMSRVIWIF